MVTCHLEISSVVPATSSHENIRIYIWFLCNLTHFLELIDNEFKLLFDEAFNKRSDIPENITSDPTFKFVKMVVLLNIPD